MIERMPDDCDRFARIPTHGWCVAAYDESHARQLAAAFRGTVERLESGWYVGLGRADNDGRFWTGLYALLEGEPYWDLDASGEVLAKVTHAGLVWAFDDFSEAAEVCDRFDGGSVTMAGGRYHVRPGRNSGDRRLWSQLYLLSVAGCDYTGPRSKGV